MSGAPGPDGRHDDLDADELEGLALLVPDDPRSLDGDRVAYLDELRQRARAGQPFARVRRALRVHDLPVLRRFGLTGSTIILLLAAVAVVGSSLTLFAPGAGGNPSTALVAPLATSAAVVGSIGGLLPDSQVSVAGTSVPLRSARPAVITLVPVGCAACGPTLKSLLMQAREYGLRLVLAGPASQNDQLVKLNDEELGGSALVVVDSSDVLRSTYNPDSPDGVSVVLVHEDGVVATVVRDVTATQRLEPALAQLDRPGASSTNP